MAVLTKEQMLEKIKKCVGEDTSDEALKLIEDVSDTINDYETKTKDTTDWEKKYKENDEQWRKKYKDRFFNVPAKDEKDDYDSDYDDESKENKLTYENLFKEETK